MVLRLARDRSLDLALVREKSRAAAAEERIVKERFFPSLGVGARFLGHDGATQDTGGDFPTVQKQSAFVGVGPSLRWELGDAIFGALSSRQRSAASIDAAEAEDRGTALRAGEGYLDLVRSQAALRVAEDALRLSESLLGETEARVKDGGGFEGDVLRSRAQASHARLRLSAAQEERRRTALALAETLDLPADVDLEPADELPPRLELVAALAPEEEMVREALAARPEVHRAEHLVEAADKDRTGARWGPLLPTIGAEASFGRLGQTFDDTARSNDYRVTLGWQIGPGGLFDGGRSALADSRASSAALEAARVRARVVREVREARGQVESRRSAIEAAEGAMEDASKALDLYRERLRTGVGLPLEAVVGEETLVRARSDWIDATADYGKAQLRLLHSLGGGAGSEVPNGGGAR
jgi:adhesin transport system outer membrane protein